MPGKTIWLINQYASTPETGMGGRHYYLAKELVRQGYHVYLIAASYTHLLRKPPDMQKRYEIRDYEGIHFVWVEMPAYRDAHDKRRVLGWFRFSLRLLGLGKVIPHRPDTILASSPSPIAFLAAQRLARKFKARLVFEVRDLWPLSLVEIGGYSVLNPFVAFLQWLEDRAYRDSDCVISSIPNAWQHMVSRGMSRSKFEWIPNGFDLGEAEQRRELDQETLSRLPRDRFIVGYAGTVGVANALDTLLDAARALRADESVAFVIVGDGKLKAALMQRARDEQLENVTVIDAIDKRQVQTMLQHFDACYIGHAKMSLHRFGVSPNKLFEYFYAARPVIYAIDSADYLPVDDANAGISVPAEDPAAIADAIRKLRDLSPDERVKLGQNAKHYALEQYEYSKLGARYARVLFEPAS